MSGFVSLKDVKKIYQMGEVEIMAAAGINFEIQKGEFAVVVGPSGAGKTTVLNILGGMDTATSGQVVVDGEDIARYSQWQLTAYRRDDIGFVFQFYNLIPNLTALENVELALQICRDPLDAKEVLTTLRDKEDCIYVLCEGGGKLPLSLLESGLVDEFHLHLAPAILGDADATPVCSGRTVDSMDEALRMRIVRTSVVDGDIHLYFRADRG